MGGSLRVLVEGRNVNRLSVKEFVDGGRSVSVISLLSRHKGWEYNQCKGV